MPETEDATHVYVKLEKPENLGIKYVGPFPIVARPSNTTIVIKVGYTKGGVPRLETHHWDRVQVAHRRPNLPDAERCVLGRRPRGWNENVNKEVGAKFNDGTTTNLSLTQPRLPASADRLTPPAEWADDGNTEIFGGDQMLKRFRGTGPPKQLPFTNNNNNKPNFSSEPTETSPTNPLEPGTSSTPGQEPGREPLPPEENGRLAPPVTKGAPSTSGPSYPSHLHDHDYYRRPSATLDHDYSRQPPNVGPPPGFENYYPEGRPRRQTNMPAKYRDYDLN